MSTLPEYLKSLEGKTLSVIGMGVSNAPLVTLLRQYDLEVTVRDRAQREAVAQRADEFEAIGVYLILGENYLENLTEDIIFRTPGLSPNTPQLVKAKENGSLLTSEMELFFAHCPCHILAVTGSDGKTTTTSVIAELLKAAGHTVFVGGNIGNPLIPQIEEMKESDWAVLELSSFQLMGMAYSPEIAVFTNLTPNHLDYHHTMEEYQQAKTNIFSHQDANHRAVFNLDNEITAQLSNTAPSQVTLFSRQQEIAGGVYLKDDAIWVGDRQVLPVNQILIPGVHNIENYMAAIAAVQGLVSDEVICTVAQTFGGVAHRIQLVRELDGVRYYNDSIGTSPNRTIACLKSFPDPIILIAGGYDKGVPFDEVAVEMVRNVKLLSLTGVTAEKIKTAVLNAPGYCENHPKIIMNENFDDAVLAACQSATAGDNVILSPACASFDQFKNFVIRGDHFCQLIATLKGEGEDA